VVLLCQALFATSAVTVMNHASGSGSVEHQAPSVVVVVVVVEVFGLGAWPGHQAPSVVVVVEVFGLGAWPGFG